MLLRWQNGGESGYVRGRCKATNLCRYCQRQYVRETVEMLILDALEDPPTCWSVLTAAEHLTRPQFNEHLRLVRRQVRAEIPSWEYFCSIEFQPQRRAQVEGNVGGLHSNLLHKGVPDARDLHALLAGGWVERVDAGELGQWTSPARDGVAVMKYVTGTLAHGLKQEQAPPIGWKGHRSSQSRGYLVRPASVMRQEARASLRWRSTMAKVEDECPDLSAVEREQLVAALTEEQAARWWAPMFGLTAEQADRLVDAGTIWREGEPGELRERVCAA